MNIVEMQLSELIPYTNNPRHNDEAVDKVAASIREFGFKVPIIVDKNNVIVAGHTRLKAAEKLGLEIVPVIRADDLTDEQVKAFRLVDNKTQELAAWDFAKLEEELGDLKNTIDMSTFGFEIDDSDVVEEDNYIPELKEETIAKYGDLFQLGDHRLMCGDSTKLKDMERLMGGVRLICFLQIRRTTSIITVLQAA